MKKRLIAFVVAACFLMFSVPAYAAEADTEVDPGITPDSVLYTADKLFEDLQLALTFDSEKEAELLLQFANERLAEAKVMTDEEKAEYVKQAMDDYLETIKQAEEKVAEVVTDENTDEETKEGLSEELEEATEVDEAVEEGLDDEQKEELETAQEEVKITANVVKDLDVEVVKSLREKDMGYGQIAHAALLAELSGKTIEEVADLFAGEEKGLGDVAKELGIHPSQINAKGEKDKPQKAVDKVEDDEQEPVELEDDEELDEDIDKEEIDEEEIEKDIEDEKVVEVDEELDEEEDVIEPMGARNEEEKRIEKTRGEEEKKLEEAKREEEKKREEVKDREEKKDKDKNKGSEDKKKGKD